MIDGANMRDDFAIFILSHGRAKKMYTLNALKKTNYTGKWYIVIDDEDETADEYHKLFGDHVVVFCKQKVVDETDTMDLLSEHKAIVYARNYSYSIAKNLGLTYFLQLDDDITDFRFRYEDGDKLRSKEIKKMDVVCNAFIEFLESTDSLTVCMCQGGDFIGGINKRWKERLLRKAMNSFFCKVDRQIKWAGTMNEDVTTYTTLGSRGKLMFSYAPCCISPLQTQSVEGGMTGVYKDNGTYVKSFYSVMSMPSAIKVGMIKNKQGRIHHHISWVNCVPKIISERYKK